MGITITWQLVVGWILSVLVVNVIINVISHYVAKTSDNQLAKLFFWWQQSKTKEDNKLNAIAERLDIDQQFQLEHRIKRSIHFALVFTTTGIMLISLGQLLFSISILNNQYRNIILSGIFSIVLAINLISIKLHSVYKKIDTRLIERLKQQTELLKHNIEIMNIEIKKLEHTKEFLEQMRTDRDNTSTKPNTLTDTIS